MAFLILFSIILISPFADSFLDVKSFNFWMIASLFGFGVFLLKVLTTNRISKKFVMITLGNFFLAMFFFNVYGQIEYGRYLLFLSSLSVFFIIRNFSMEQESQFWRLEGWFFNVIAAYALVQIFSSLALDYDISIHRGREYFGIKQVASFFAEPAFFSIYLNWRLFLHFFFNFRPSLNALLATYILVFFTFSLTGIIGSVFITFVYFFHNMNVKKLRRPANFLGLVFAFGGLAAVVVSSGFLDIISRRLLVEVIEVSPLFFESPMVGELSGSGTVRIIGEVQYLFYVLREHPLFGYGLSYDEEALLRLNSYNALTEIAVRWGMLGILTFFILVQPVVRYLPIVGGGYLLIFLSSDGAIGKPEFWVYLGVLVGLASTRLRAERNTLFGPTEPGRTL